MNANACFCLMRLTVRKIRYIRYECALTIKSYLFLTSGYCCLHIMSKQFAPSPLTSEINKAFSSRENIQRTFSVTMPVWGNQSRSAVSEMLQSAALSPTRMSQSKSLWSPFFSILMLSLNFCLNHVYYFWCHLYKFSNKHLNHPDPDWIKVDD